MKFILPKSTMHQVMIARVNAYFEKNKISPTGNWKLYIKTIFGLVMLISSYLALIFFPHLNNAFRIFLCLIHGLSWAYIGFNVVHDAAHGSYSTRKNINDILTRLFDFVGASSFMWKTKHNILHHTYTNVDDLDDDIETGGALRLTPNQEWKWYHIFQVIYVTPLYLILYILWISQKDIGKYLTGKIGSTKIPPMSKKEKVLFWSFKFLYIAIYIVIPVILFGWVALVGYLIAAGICGLTISIVFQLAHIVGKARFPIPNQNKDLESDFAHHQAMTTVDFATRNPVISWFVGGLNFQVIHHFFPKVSHVHYPAIQKIVKETLKEYGVTYNEYRTAIGAICAHYYHLFRMGLNLR